MFGFEKNVDYLVTKKKNALLGFYSAKEKLSKVVADQELYAIEVNEKMNSLKKEKEYLDKEIKSTNKILDKINEFLD
jgi:CHASE3 domain sensor protein